MAGDIRGKVAIAGIGETTYYKHGQAPDSEFKLALIQGTLLGAIAVGRVLAEYPDELWSAVTIGVAVCLVIIVGVFLGISSTLGIELLKLDPAAGAAPLTTVFADMCGITLLCVSAYVILGAREPIRV